jgi:hypothetical protein
VRLNELFNDRSKLVFAQKIYDFPEEIAFLGIYELSLWFSTATWSANGCVLDEPRGKQIVLSRGKARHFGGRRVAYYPEQYKRREIEAQPTRVVGPSSKPLTTLQTYRLPLSKCQHTGNNGGTKSAPKEVSSLKRSVP